MGSGDGGTIKYCGGSKLLLILDDERDSRWDAPLSFGLSLSIALSPRSGFLSSVILQRKLGLLSFVSPSSRIFLGLGQILVHVQWKSKKAEALSDALMHINEFLELFS